MGRSTRYPAEVRERAVKMVLEHTDAHESQWAAICSIAEKFGCSAETLPKWVRQSEAELGKRKVSSTVYGSSEEARSHLAGD